jgi:hypothetical protein
MDAQKNDVQQRDATTISLYTGTHDVNYAPTDDEIGHAIAFLMRIDKLSVYFASGSYAADMWTRNNYVESYARLVSG